MGASRVTWNVSSADNDDVVAKMRRQRGEERGGRLSRGAMRRLHIGSIKCMATSPPEPRNRAPILVTGGSDDILGYLI